MSRTFRKNIDPVCWVDRDNQWNFGYAELRAKKANVSIEKFKEQERARYKTRTRKYFNFTLPWVFRNSVNRQRRAKDRTAIHNEIYEKRFADYATWNCKDSDSWGYW